MNSPMKKLCALALALCLGVLSGCGEAAAPEDISPGVESTVSTGKSFRNVDIYPISTDAEGFDVVLYSGVDGSSMDMIRLFDESVGVKNNYLPYTVEEIRFSFIRGSIPDVICNSSAISKAEAFEYGSAGLLINFMDYLEYMPNLASAIAEDPSLLDPVRNADGTVYTLPKIGRTTTSAGNLLYLRMDMLREAGWSQPPETTEEFLRCIRDVQAHFGSRDPRFTAFTVYSARHMSSHVSRFLFPSFGPLLETRLTVAEDGNTVVLGAATEQYKHYLEFMHEVFESGAFYRDVFTEDGSLSMELILANRVAVTTHGSWLTTENFASGELDMVILEPLTSEYWDRKHWLTETGSVYTLTCISSQCRDIPAMCRWLDAMYAPMDNPLDEAGMVSGQTLWMGRRGVDFIIDEENKCLETRTPEGYESYTQWHDRHCLTSTLGLYDFMYIQVSNAGIHIKSKGTVNNLYPYAEEPVVRTDNLSLSEAENAVFNDIWPGINAYIQDMTVRFITGAEDIGSGWEGYLARLEALGLPRVLDIYQDAFDRYMETNR